MRLELEKFKENKYWLFGPSIFAQNYTAASCTGLAHTLLQSGGIGKLVSPSLTVRDCLFVIPNNLSRLVLLAKQKEEYLEKK